VLWVFLSFFLENEVISLFIPHRSMPNHFELSAANLEKITEISKFSGEYLRKTPRKRLHI
jgi:hypothetical protein